MDDNSVDSSSMVKWHRCSLRPPQRPYLRQWIPDLLYNWITRKTLPVFGNMELDKSEETEFKTLYVPPLTSQKRNQPLPQKIGKK